MSNYAGYLVKIKGNSDVKTDYIIPLKYIKATTYQATLYGQDLDSYRDANGDLHREALSHFAPKCEFETIPMMTDKQVLSFLHEIRSRMVDKKEKKVKADIWIMELNRYVTHYFYMPDITFTPYYADSKVIKYNPFRLAFISYGGAV